MHWVAPAEKDAATTTLETRLWEAADQFRANSGLKSQEYSAPVLGLIFLRFADARFATQRAKLEKAGASSRRGSRADDPAAYHAEGNIPDNLALQREARGLETKRDEAWCAYDAAAREIEIQKDGLLDQVEERLGQNVSDEELFAIKFQIR